MNLAYTAPTKENEFYWVERSEKLTVFLGPFISKDESVQEALLWKQNGGLLSPEHAEIFLTFSTIRDGVLCWDIYKPIQKLGMILW